MDKLADNVEEGSTQDMKQLHEILFESPKQMMGLWVGRMVNVCLSAGGVVSGILCSFSRDEAVLERRDGARCVVFLQNAYMMILAADDES